MALATQFRSMARTWRTRTRILRSSIQGWGLYAAEDHAAGQFVIEYCGEVVPKALTDLREAAYNAAGIGCYMFGLSNELVCDATRKGNAARFVNHSCEPNCETKRIWLTTTREVIVILTKRAVARGEEFTYDYMFPYDADDRLSCNCGAPSCRGFMN